MPLERELPPRTRRIRRRVAVRGGANGTTSAHAENTEPSPTGPIESWNYLRARGEYKNEAFPTLTRVELPPRTRRIRTRAASPCHALGTTSAHAENTTPMKSIVCSIRNYLRARGEYSPWTRCARSKRELPPRTRRILPADSAPKADWGTTSAHAENTFCARSRKRCSRNYLRARGEYPATGPLGADIRELPPRTRRIPV